MALLANWRSLPPSSLYSLPSAAHLAMVPSLRVEAQPARGQSRDSGSGAGSDCS